MAAIRVGNGSTWSAPVANGKLNSKWGGGWFNPQAVYAKISDGTPATNGGYGANPRWVDTGYRGYPAVPAQIWVAAWDYSNVVVQWSAGSGGAAVSAWHVVQTNANGDVWLNQVETTSGQWNTGINWDTRYRYYVRAKAASGLYSAFQGPLNVGIGHPTQYTYGYVQRARDWSSSLNGNWYKDAYNGTNPGGTMIYVPNSVLIQSIVYDIAAVNNFTAVLSPYPSREIHHIYGNNDAGDVAHWTNPTQGAEGYNNWGGDSYWGFICRGSGWTVSPTGLARVVGWITVNGLEYYDNYEIVSTIDEQGNYYW